MQIKTLDPYRFISQSVSVGAKQSRLRSEEGPRHAASCRRRLLLQLALQRRHLEENMQGERGQEKDGK